MDKDHDPCPQVLISHKLRVANIQISKEITFQWQSSFYDRLIRNELEFDHYLGYINEKNLFELASKYDLLSEDQLEKYHFYSHASPDLINPY